MKKLIVLISFITFAFIATASAALPDCIRHLMDKEVYGKIAEAAENFAARFPVKDYIYVGVGRSPHAYLAYLEANLGAEVRYIPLSHPGDQYCRLREGLLPPEIQLPVLAHIAHFLPDAQTLGHRKILLVDFAASGAGIVTAGYYVEEALQAKGIGSAALTVVPLTDHSGNNLLRAYTSQMKEEGYLTAQIIPHGRGEDGVLRYSDEFLQEAMDLETFWLQETAPVGFWDVNAPPADDPGPLARRPEYGALIQWLKSSYTREQ